MTRCQYITHKGIRLLFADYTGLHGDELLNTIKQATQMMLDHQEGDLLFLGDFSNTYVDDTIMAYLQNDESKRAAKKSKKIAVTGITGLKKLFMNMYNTVTGGGARAFENQTAAKDYLIS